MSKDIGMLGGMSSMRLSWTKDLSVGIAEIDAQHRDLLDCFNETLAAAQTGPKDVVARLLESLGDMASAHFAFENNLLDPAVPQEAAHRNEHVKLLDEYGKLIQDWAAGDIHVREVLRFVAIWLVRHIAAMDVPSFRRETSGTDQSSLSL
jgi:hemerythrin